MANDARNIPADPTTTLITEGLKSITDIGKQIIGGSQANQAARDNQSYLLDAQKEASRLESLKGSLALTQDLRERRFDQLDAERAADLELANPLTTQTKYLLWGAGGLLVVALVGLIIFLNKG